MRHTLPAWLLVVISLAGAAGCAISTKVRIESSHPEWNDKIVMPRVR